MAKLRPGDTSFIYFGGRGEEYHEKDVLLPIEFRGSSATMYPVDTLLQSLDERYLGLNVVVLDACRELPFRQGNSVSPGFSAIEGGRQTVIVFPTSPGGVTDAPRQPTGVFPRALLQFLKDQTLDVDSLFTKVKEQVSTETQGTQVPFISSHLEVPRYLGTPPKPPPAPPAVSISVSKPSPETPVAAKPAARKRPDLLAVSDSDSAALAATAPSPKAGAHGAGIAALTIGAAALAAATVLGVTARLDTNSLQTNARPLSQGKAMIQSINTRSLSANALFGAGGGLAALGVGLVVAF